MNIFSVSEGIVMAATNRETEPILQPRVSSAGYESFEKPSFYLSSASEPESEESYSKRLLEKDNADYTRSEDA
jgi:hypothetical protein